MSAPVLAFKGVAVDEGANSQIVDINEAEGVVTAVVSVTGVKDDVDDVIEPGAYAETLKVRTPKVCWHHAWEKPVGRTPHIIELMPGDPRLPTKQRNGQPWPKEAGALVATMQFNLKSERGREAFEAVRFYSETGECEWSIGYQVPAGKSRRDKQGVRWIKAIDLFELSFVLFGAHNMTGTLSLKAAVLVMSRHLKAAAAGAVAVGKEEFDLVIKSLTMEDDYPVETKAGKKPDDDEDEAPDDEAVEPPPVTPDEPADEDEEDDEDEDAPPVEPPAADAAPVVPPSDTPPPPAADPAADAADADDPDPEIPPVAVDEEEQDVLVFPGDDDDIAPEDAAGDDEVPDDNDDEDEEDEEDEDKPAAKALASARLVIKSQDSQVTIDADGNLTVRGELKRFDLTPLGEIKDTNPGDQSQGARELIHWYERGEGAAKIRWGEDGDFMRCVRIAEKHMTPEQAKGFCSNRHLGALGVRPGQEKAYAADDDLADTPPPDQMANEEPKDQNDPHETGVMVAVYPSADVADQLVVRGGEKADELHVTLAYLGNSGDDIGDGMTLGDATGRIVAAVQIAAAGHQSLSGTVGGIGKFPDSGDGVPVWAPVDVVGLGAVREAVVTALTDAGLPVKTDHGFTPHMTLGYNLDMSLIPPSEAVPVTFDKLCVAVGGERTEVPLGGDVDIPISGAPVNGAPLNPPLDGEQKAAAYDPAIEIGPDAGYKSAVPRPAKSFPYLEGTYEERQRLLDQALCEALLPEPDPDSRSIDAYVNIDGTWPDRVVCTVNNWAGPGPGDRQSFEVPYTVAEDGTVMLGEPAPVKLTVIAVDDDGGELDDDVPVGDLLPLAEMIETVTGSMKTIGVGTEQKAGRVLSGANAQRLKAAIEHLIAVVASAGIEIADPTNDQARVNPTVDDETTAPAAREAATKALTAVDVTAALSQFDEVLLEP